MKKPKTTLPQEPTEGKVKKSKVYQKGASQMNEHEFWNFPPAFPRLPDVAESICGVNDESQDVERYSGALGVTVAFVNNRQRPVGQLQWNNNLAIIYTIPGNVSGVRWGSGTLISRDLFITAGHCFDQDAGGWTLPRINGTSSVISNAEIATNMHVNFNYQVNSAGVLQPAQAFAVTQLIEHRLNGLDFAIVRLAGNPGDTYGWTSIAANDANVGDMLCIIQHPNGEPKKIEAGPCYHLHDDRVGYDDIDTLPGSSGSGILRASDGRLVGVHTNGGCSTAAASHNHGFRITSLVVASPTLRGILSNPPTLKFRDDVTSGGGGFKKIVDDGVGPSFKFSDDAPSLKFRDDGVGNFKKIVDDGVGPSLKFRDDAPSLKFRDDPKLKAIDDVKTVGSDLPFPIGPDPRQINPVPSFAGRGESPFLLATPHHSNQWEAAMGVGSTNTAGSVEEVLVQAEAGLANSQNYIDTLLSELAEAHKNHQLLWSDYLTTIHQYYSGQ